MDPEKKCPVGEYITDKSLRIRSYLRRRPVPFKRAAEVDVQIGTKSLLISLCEEVEECCYVGEESLVSKFLSEGGLSLEDVLQLGKTRFRAPTSLFPPRCEEEGKEEEEEYSPTVEERRKKERAKKREAAQRVSDGEFLRNPQERAKVFHTRKESLMAKLVEMDAVCGSKSFLVIVSAEKEAVFYQGSVEMVSQFFAEGLSSSMIHRNINIRPFEPDETDCNVCSVPHCVVSRNTLSKWRLAAIDLFGFPDNIPMTMYACPEADRDQWMAELDLDPTVVGKITVCSLHFKEGYPTDEYPYPTELLSESTSDATFKGVKTTSWRVGAIEQKSSEDIVCDILEDLLTNVDKTIQENEERRSQRLPYTCISRSRRLKSKKKHFLNPDRHLMLLPQHNKNLIKLKHRSRTIDILRFYRRKSYRLGFCNICKRLWKDGRELFDHVRTEHLGLPLRLSAGNDIIKGETSPVVNLNLSPAEYRGYLAKLYPSNRVPTMNPRKKYVCAVCKSQCDLYGLFVHMKQVHKGVLCQYCLKLFKKIEDLEVHLKSSHRVFTKYYHSFEKFQEISGTRYNFMCGQCNKMVRYSDLVNSVHRCGTKSNNNNSTDCPYCDRVFPGAHQLEMHLVNGWCKFATNKNPSFNESSRLYNVLSGKSLNHSEVRKLRQTLKSPPPPGKEEIKNARLPAKKEFSVADRQILMKYHFVRNNKKVSNFKSSRIIKNIPLNGNIFCGVKSRGITNNLKKEIKDEGYKYDEIKDCDVIRYGKNLVVNYEVPAVKTVPPIKLSVGQAMRPLSNVRRSNARSRRDSSTRHSSEDKENFGGGQVGDEEEDSATSYNGVEDDDQSSSESSKEPKLQRLTREYEEILENLSNMKNTIRHFGDKCLVCQQAHVVCVDSIYLMSHLHIIHDKTVVLSILKQEPQKCINRMKRYLKETKSKEIIFSYQQDKELQIDFYNCSYCSTTACLTNDDLFRHLEKEHSQKVLTCNLCQSIFLNYGSFISHVCYGPPTNSQKQKAAKFNCKICLRQDLSSFLIFQNHVRRDHNICEICFKNQGTQVELYHHCLQHSQELMCMKCFLTYDKYDQFRKHLYFKHYDECRICGICYQKTWPHVYHFCIKDLPSSCEVCDRKFESTKQYRVHLRTHTKIHPYTCTANNCSKSFISKQLLWKHQIRRHPDLSISATKALEDKRNSKEVQKYKASSIQVVRDIQTIINDIIIEAIIEPDSEKETEKIEPSTPEPEKDEIDPLQAAVASIMGADGVFNTKRSPVKPVNITSPTKPVTISLNPTPSSTIMISPSFAASSSSNPGPFTTKPDNKDSPKIMHPSEYFNSRSPSKMTFKSDSDCSDDDRNTKLDGSKGVVPFPSEGASSAPVVGGIWNQDLFFVSNGPNTGKAKVRKPGMNKSGGGLKVMKPITESSGGGILSKISSPTPKTFTSLDPNLITKKLGSGGWEVCLSESSGDSDNGGPDKPKKVKMIDKIIDRRIPILDHDYCYESYMLSLEPPKPPELSEMDKILSNVALGVMDHLSPDASPSSKKKQKHKKNKKDSKKKKKKKKKNKKNNDSSSDSEDESRKTPALTTPFMRKTGPKPKYHTPSSGAGGVTAGTGRITFNSSSEDEDDDDEHPRNGDKRNSNDEASSCSDICSSDLDTDFSADEFSKIQEDQEEHQVEKEKTRQSIAVSNKVTLSTPAKDSPKPSLKLKIRLPAPSAASNTPPPPITSSGSTKIVISKNRKRTGGFSNKSRFSSGGSNRPLSKKMRESLALNRGSSSSSSSSYSEEEEYTAPPKAQKSAPKAYIINDSHGSSGIMYNSDPERLYCVCQCPHDEVSEMIGCDAPDCKKEWFHFECVGILVPPEGKWYCPECSSRYKIRS